MKVKELIESLKSMPQDAEVRQLWDTEDNPRSVDVAYHAADGRVYLSHDDWYVTKDSMWPVGQREKTDRFDSFYLGVLTPNA